MQPHVSRRLLKYGLLLAAVLLGAYVASMLTGPQGVRALREKDDRIQDLERTNRRLMEEIQEKKEEIERLKGKGVEEAIREGTGMMRENERRFVEPGRRQKPARKKR